MRYRWLAFLVGSYFLCRWVGTAAGILGALLIALNLGVVVWGYWFFLVSSVLWLTVAWVDEDYSLALLQGIFVLVNVLGLLRWVGMG